MNKYNDIFNWLYKVVFLILGIIAVFGLKDLNENIKNVSYKLDVMTKIVAYKNNVDVVESIDLMSKTVSDSIDNLRLLR